MNFITLIKAENNRIIRLNVDHIEQYEIGLEFVDGKLQYKEELTKITLINEKVILVKENVMGVDCLINQERKENASYYSK